MGLYGERTGAFTVVCADPEEAKERVYYFTIQSAFRNCLELKWIIYSILNSLRYKLILMSGMHLMFVENEF